MSNKLKHLDFIQSAIGRLAQNSFLVKGWSILSVSAVLAIAFRESSSAAPLLAILPTAMFWVLDSYYLAMERRYRRLYDSVIVKAEADIDFSMAHESDDLIVKEVFDAMWAISNTLHYPTIVVILILTTAFF